MYRRSSRRTSFASRYTRVPEKYSRKASVTSLTAYYYLRRSRGRRRLHRLQRTREVLEEGAGYIGCSVPEKISRKTSASVAYARNLSAGIDRSTPSYTYELAVGRQ